MAKTKTKDTIIGVGTHTLGHASSLGVNPKDEIGNSKLGFHHIPLSSLLHLSAAMEDGVKKYGLYNWRESKIKSEIYIDAAIRHILSWVEGEDLAVDSGVHHFGHVMACMAILLDAESSGTLVDHRNKIKKSVPFTKLMTNVKSSMESTKYAK